MKRTITITKGQSKECHNRKMLGILWHLIVLCLHNYQHNGGGKGKRDKKGSLDKLKRATNYRSIRKNKIKHLKMTTLDKT